jgi:hypothetical protein
MENNIKGDLIRGIKAIILSAQFEGWSGQQTLEAICVFCDTMEDLGVPPQTVAEAFNETMSWVRGRVETLRSQHSMSMN